MTDLRTAAQQALEALDEIHRGNMTPMAEEAWNKAITALKAALAEPAQEPADALDLDDMLVVRYLNPRQPGETLRQVIDRIINWDVAVALDPLVSSDAQALIDKGRAEAVQEPADALREALGDEK